MEMLALGLVLFLGTHSVRIVADGWRTRMLGRVGANGFKAVYSLLALAGLVLIVIGYGAAREQDLVLFEAPRWTGPLATLLMLPALALAVASLRAGHAHQGRDRPPAGRGDQAVGGWPPARERASGRRGTVRCVPDLGRHGFQLAAPARSRERHAIPRWFAAALWAAMLAGGHGWLTGVSLLAP